jgi:hypothetical protein
MSMNTKTASSSKSIEERLNDYPELKAKIEGLLSVVSVFILFICAPDFSLLKPLRSVTRFLCLGRARIIHDANMI